MTCESLEDSVFLSLRLNIVTVTQLETPGGVILKASTPLAPKPSLKDFSRALRRCQQSATCQVLIFAALRRILEFTVLVQHKLDK